MLGWLFVNFISFGASEVLEVLCRADGIVTQFLGGRVCDWCQSRHYRVMGVHPRVAPRRPATRARYGCWKLIAPFAKPTTVDAGACPAIRELIPNLQDKLVQRGAVLAEGWAPDISYCKFFNINNVTICLMLPRVVCWTNGNGTKVGDRRETVHRLQLTADKH